MNNDIFDIAINGKTCRDCIHRQRHEKGAKVIQYCAVNKSWRTANGLLKIKASGTACLKYQQELANRLSLEGK